MRSINSYLNGTNSYKQQTWHHTKSPAGFHQILLFPPLCNIFCIFIFGSLSLFVFASLSCEGQIGGIAVQMGDFDADGDGYCIAGYEDNELCTINGMPGQPDCDDNDSKIHPDSVEICNNNIDEDCDGFMDEDCGCSSVTLYQDSDRDGFGDPDDPYVVCVDDTPVAGYVDDNTDCNDQDPGVNPSAIEVCGNVVDENCNADLELDTTFYHDSDKDGFGDPQQSQLVCTQNPPAGYVVDNTDCDDSDASVYPGSGCGTLVTNTQELQLALASATPGELIVVASGTYSGRFEITRSGEPGQYITIRGVESGGAVLVGKEVGYRGTMEIHHQKYIIVENLEITNPKGELGVYLTGENGDSTQGDGCSHVILRNLYVHDVGDEAIKIRNLNTHDILIENNRVHSSNGSGIDVQGGYPDRFPPPSSRPRRFIIRNNLIWDAGFAGIANEVADQLHIYNNIILGSRIGLDIGCGNNIIIRNNLVTSYEHYAAILDDPSLTTIDLNKQPRHPDVHGKIICRDGIAVSGTFMTLISDNEITDCQGNGDLIISYDHWDQGLQHNINGGHRFNLFFRNRIHDNQGAFQTIKEYDKQEGSQSFDQIYVNNLFVGGSKRGIRFEHSVRLIFANNLVIGDVIDLGESSINAVIKNNILYDADGINVSADSTDLDQSNNVLNPDSGVFVDFANADYHLDASAAGVCIDQGADLTSVFVGVFGLFDAAFTTQDFNWHPDFAADMPFDYRKDLDGNEHDALWDVGAYAVPR